MPTVKPTKVAPEPPIILDFGKKRRKQIKLLKKETGKLTSELQNCIKETIGQDRRASQACHYIVTERSLKLMLSGLLPRL